jgi:Chaperone of endosialidase
MKKIATQILLGLLAAAVARADTTLSLTSAYSCLTDLGPNPIPNPPTVTGNFNLNGISGSGVLQSRVTSYYYANFQDPNLKDYFYSYSIDLSGMSPSANHCVRLVVHFGEPVACFEPGVECDPGKVQSATLAPFGDITFVFAGGCLNPGQSAVVVGMMSTPVPFKTNVVTVIDDYVDQASGLTNETRMNVPALVPDIPPNPPPWVFYHPIKFPAAFIQGALYFGTNQYLPPTNGFYDFSVQLQTAQSNGLAVSQMITQTVQVVNGLFNMPLPFDPISMGDGSMGDGSVRWLNIAVRKAGGSSGFTPLNPPLPITPTPQAFYAYTAGSVADLAPGQAVTSLDGLSDAVNLQAGNGLILETNGNTLVIGAQPGVPSDRSIKTDFASVNPQNILSRLAALPIGAWRYTNEVPGVRHVGPMAQDFKAAFGLGNNDKIIGFVDEEGVALAAIQGLDQKLEHESKARDAEIERQGAEIRELNARIEALEKIILEQKSN